MGEHRENTPWGVQRKSSAPGRPSYETHKQTSANHLHLAKVWNPRADQLQWENRNVAWESTSKGMLPHHLQNRSAVFLEDPQEPFDQSLELIKELSKLTDCIISIENLNLTLNEKHFRNRTHWYCWPSLREPRPSWGKGWAAQPKTGGRHTAVERRTDALNTSSLLPN